MDEQNTRSYYTYRRIANKHDIKVETITGKPVTYHKLKHRVDQFEHKKRSSMNRRNTLTEQDMRNHMVRYMNCEIDDKELNNIMYHYIGI